MAKCKIDLSNLSKQLSFKQEQIEEGVRVGFQQIAPELEEIYKYFQQQYVYDVYDPEYYERTEKLKDSTTSEVTEDTTKIVLTIYSDPEKVPSNKFGSEIPYSYFVTTGYKMWNTGKFMFPRDWTEPMQKELINYLEQNGTLRRAIINEVNKRL